MGKQARNAFPAWRVFVFGEEVTEDVLSCSVTMTDDANAPGTAQFTLASKDRDQGYLDRYIITENDVQALLDIEHIDVATPDKKPILEQAIGITQAATQKAHDDALAARRKYIDELPPDLTSNLVATEAGFKVNYGRRYLDDALKDLLAAPTIAGRLAQSSDTADSAAADIVQARTAAYNKTVRDTFVELYDDAYRTVVREAYGEVLPRVNEALSAAIRDPVKRRVLAAKFSAGIFTVEQPGLDITETGAALEARVNADENLRYLSYLKKGEAYRYPMPSGHCLFHSNDPVRIFWRDPLNPRAWYHMFSGFVSNWEDDQSVNGEKVVTITCEDVLRIFRYTRISTNPGLFDIRAIQGQEDFVIRSFFGEGFPDLTLGELMFLLVFGPEPTGLARRLFKPGSGINDTISNAKKVDYERLNSRGEQSVVPVNRFGVGAFNFDRSMSLILGSRDTHAKQIFAKGKGVLKSDNEPQVAEISRREVPLTGADALGEYQAIVDHRVRVDDVITMAIQGDVRDPVFIYPKDVTGSPTIEAIITEIGTNPQRYPIDGGRLIMLTPASLGPSVNRRIASREFINSVALRTTWKTRLSMIYSVLERIEFRFWASPKGDLLAEMPLYDFDPSDFGSEPISKDSVNKIRSEAYGARLTSELGLLRDDQAANGRGAYGPFEAHYRISKEDTLHHTRTFSDEKVRTQVVTQWSPLQSYLGAVSVETTGQAPAVTTLRALVPQFGIRAEEPPPTTFVASKEAAKIWGELHLNKLNADAITASLDAIPRLQLTPNRPVEVSDRTYIGSVRSVMHSIDWGSRDMNMNLGLNYVRMWDGTRTKDNNMVYSTLGGLLARGLNYAALWQPAKFDDLKKVTRNPDAAQQELITRLEARTALPEDERAAVRANLNRLFPSGGT